MARPSHARPSSATETDQVILVDRDDRDIGVLDKLEAHRRGALHRAFSVFVFDEGGRLLLQCRSAGKYHSGGLWSNACCSHPRPGEDMADAVARRTAEELGVRVQPEKVLEAPYDLDVGGGLREAEYNHVHIARLSPDTTFAPDPDEIQELRWATAEAVLGEIEAHPEEFSPWFRLLLPRVLAQYRDRQDW